MMFFSKRTAASSGGPFSHSFVNTAASTTSTDEYTFPSVSLGATPSPGEKRYIVMGVSAAGTQSATLALVSAVIAGVAATIIEQERHNPSSNQAAVSAIVIAEVPTGTTGDVVLNFSAFCGSGCEIGWEVVYNLPSITPAATGKDTGIDPDLSLNTAANSYVFAVSSCLNAGATTWTGVTELYDDEWTGGNEWASAGSAYPVAAATPHTVTANNADDTPLALSGVSAAWTI